MAYIWKLAAQAIVEAAVHVDDADARRAFTIVHHGIPCDGYDGRCQRHSVERIRSVDGISKDSVDSQQCLFVRLLGVSEVDLGVTSEV